MAVFKSILLTLGILFSAQWLSAQQSQPTLKNQAGIFHPERNQGLLSEATWAAIPSYEQAKWVCLQFDELPNAETETRLKQRGIELETYLPVNSFYARVPENYVSDRFANLSIAAVQSIPVEQKIHFAVKQQQIPDYARAGDELKFMLSLHNLHDIQPLLQFLLQHGVTVLNNYNQQHLAIQMNANTVAMVAAHPAVQFINYIDAPLQKENLANRTDHRSNAIHTDYGAGRHYDGTGVRIGLTDDGYIGPHIDYEGRTNQDAVLNYNTGNHGDHCGGTIMSAGNMDPLGKGMAPGADLWVYDALSGSNYILEDSLFTSPNLSLDIISTSYSNGCNSGYNSGAESADRQTRSYKNIMRVFSAGNDGTSNCSYGAGSGWGNITGGIKSAKNVIAVANLNYVDVLANSSSRGPATDGRIKPDVSAVGTDVYSTIDTNDYELKTGTSMSCPGVSGLFGQLYHAYRDLHAGADPNTGLLKNILMNTCDDIGNPGPDFKHGFGRVNGLRAVKVLEAQQHLVDSVSTGGTKTFTLAVPSNTHRLKVMLYWVDKEAAVSATTALVNDLDFTIINPSNTTYLPWVLNHAPNATTLNANAQRLTDHLNNVEQITIDTPAAGNYTLQVDGFAVPFGPQEFFISYEFIPFDSLELTYPLGGEGLVTGESQTIRWNAINTGNTFNLDFSSDNGNNWTSIITNVPAAQAYYNWTVPNLVSGQCKIRITRNGITSTSPSVFSVIRVPQNVSVVRVCPDTITVKWNSVTGATAYRVYTLGNKYMDSTGTTTDTFYHFTGLNINDAHWFSVSALHNPTNAVGRRAFAIQQLPGLMNCILANDAEMVSCESPGKSTIVSCAAAATTDVSITFKNNGISTLTSLPLAYQLDNNTVVQDTYSGSVASGATSTFTFTTPLGAIAAGTHTLKIWTALAGDNYPGNDTVVISLEALNGMLASLPWEENFETHTVCPTVNNCDNTDCLVTNGLINEKNLVIDQFDWKVFEGETPTTNTGPDVDHTTGSITGKYVYLETSYCFEQQANLLTPCFSLSPGTVPYFIFWYHLFGNGQGSLHVDAFVDGAWQNDIVAAVSGNKGNTWFKQEVDLTQFVGKTIYLRLRGVTGTNQRSDMALDDLRMIDSSGAAAGVHDLGIGWNLYPNPASNELTIGITPGLTSPDQVLVYNSIGEFVLRKQLTTSQTNYVLDISSLPTGIYWVVAKDGQRVLGKKMFVKE
jgi:hypothetical protein